MNILFASLKNIQIGMQFDYIKTLIISQKQLVFKVWDSFIKEVISKSYLLTDFLNHITDDAILAQFYKQILYDGSKKENFLYGYYERVCN